MSQGINNEQQEREISLDGLDGSNPLAFLAALGTLRITSKSLPEHCVMMGWRTKGGAWRPSLRAEPRITRDELVGHIDAACRYGVSPKRRCEGEELEKAFRSASSKLEIAKADIEKSLKKLGLSGKKLVERLKAELEPFERVVAHCERSWFENIAPCLLIGDDLTLDRAEFSAFAAAAARDASREHRCSADFAASFGSDAVVGDDGRIADTALRTMAGAGHQHFLGFMRKIIAATTIEHLRKTLFESWRYDDPVQNLTLRWDPADDSRYALQWRNPSGDPSRRSSGSMLGANRLAIEGLPLLPTVPQLTGLKTTGFRGRKASDIYWTWPIWSAALSLDATRSVLAHSELQEDKPNHAELSAYGIEATFRSRRLTIGKVRNFTPGRSV